MGKKKLTEDISPYCEAPALKQWQASASTGIWVYAIITFLVLASTTLGITFAGVPSITEGIAVGFISYAVLKLVSGKIKDIHPILGIFAFLFLLRYIFL